MNPCGNNNCNAINSGIDECIKPLIKALNDCGLETVASCCGHGNRPGSIILRDNREIMIMSYEEARKFDKVYPDIHGNQRSNPSVPGIYQYRFLQTSPDCVDCGQHSEWKTCNKDKYDEINRYIKDGYTYETRELTIKIQSSALSSAKREGNK